MKLTFRLRFRTNYGQSLWLTGNHLMFGGGDSEKAIPLQYLDQEFWQVTIPLTGVAVPKLPIRYNYILREADGSIIQDGDNNRMIDPASFNCNEVLVIDTWNHPGACENVFYTEPFQQVLLKANHTAMQSPTPPAATHTFRVKAPLLANGQTLCLLGEAAALGNWNTTRPLLLNRVAGESLLSIQLDLSQQPFPIAYKYGVYDIKTKTFVRYEDGENRILHDPLAPNQHTMVNDGFVRLPANTWKGAGVAIPVFSLRSENSFGVGEFLDLKPLADWAKQAGLKLIQILPVNDTTATHTWTDSYPYAAISAFALHPLYLNLAGVANAKNQKLLAALEPERHRLNALDTVDYEAVTKAKLGFLKRIFPSQKAATFRSREYKKFFTENKHWLAPYAAFCFLRDQFGTADFNQWPEHQNYDGEKIAALVAAGILPAVEPGFQPGGKGVENLEAAEKSSLGPGGKMPPCTAGRMPAATVSDEIAFHFFVQFHLHLQLREATAHAHANGIIVKGDIAIGVSRHGADVWQEPELFHMDTQAGAPPDAFAVKGQNWGFPTYNWPRMKQDGFAWWKRRFEQMSYYFDAFRIDHILGFFRIWSLPLDAVEGILGHFVPAIPVEVDEFAARGIAFDRERFTKPFITDAVLQEVLGDESEAVRREFLNVRSPAFTRPGAFREGRHGTPNIYSLKPEFATQRQVEKYFAGPAPSEHHAKIKSGLFDLISNVILLEVEGKFHFRFAMDQTASFKHLPSETQAQLKELYVDYFFRRQDDFWTKEAAQKLSALKRATNMLVCGEDLGLVPACVPKLMKQLGLLSLEIQRMPKEPGQEFSRPQDAPYLSVVTPATHDMSTLRGWWEEDRTLTQKFFNADLGQPGEAPRECEPRLVLAIIRQHLASPAMWSIFQLQDLLGMDAQLRRADADAERINVPAIPNFYWRYRMHLTLEQLRQAENFNAALCALIRQSGR